MRLLSIALLTLFCCILFADANAQMRKLRPDEVAFYNTLHKTMYTSVPHAYKDWKVANDDEPDFDINNYWCQDRHAPDADCKGMTVVSIGKGDPYSLVTEVAFAMTSDESDRLGASSMVGLTDYTNAAQIAKALKAAAKTKLSIQIVANLDGGDFDLSYCGKTPPEKITLPVPATLALKGIRSESCPIMSSGAPDMSANYYDNAIIFLGKPVASKTADNRSDGLSGNRYKIGFDHSKISKPMLQNIAVNIKGDAADIDAAIAMIDWKSLYALIGK